MIHALTDEPIHREPVGALAAARVRERAHLGVIEARQEFQGPAGR